MNQFAPTFAADSSRIDASLPRLAGSWLRAARTVWIVLALGAIIILVASLPGYGLKLSGQLNPIPFK